MLSLGSIEAGHVIMRLLTIYTCTCICSEISNLGAMTWLCYIEYCVIVRRVIMRLRVPVAVLLEPSHEKTGFLPMGKQRRRSASQ